MEEQGNILRFWRDVEVFTIPSPPTNNDRQIPAPRSTQATITVGTYAEAQPLPWQAPPSIPPSSTTEHALYLGGQDTVLLIQKILRTLVPTAKIHEKDLEGLSGQGCLGVFCVNQDGVPLAESYTAASFVVGVHAYRTGISLDGLAQRLSEAQKSFDERRFAIRRPEEAEDPAAAENRPEPLKKIASPYRPVTWQILREECQILFDQLGIEAPEQLHIVIKTTETPVGGESKKDKKSQAQAELLNSFYLNDLDILIRQCDRAIPFGGALATYLGPPSTKDSRRDILQDPTAMCDLLNPAYLPAGRWPALSKYHLLLGQQAAVSGILACSTSEKGSLVAVNGPPGTGKTTLLSDIIAEVVVQRAENICTYTQPWQIFEDKISCAGNKLYPLRKDVARHTGIVVTSNNNSAVENITLDLPSKSKIAQGEHPGAAYFSEVMQGIFSCSKIQSESWGLVAGALGSKSNRIKFCKAFMWGDPASKISGIMNILAAAQRDTADAPTRRWQKAKESFLALKKSISSQKTHFSACYQALKLQPRLQQLATTIEGINARTATLQLDKEVCYAAIRSIDLDKPGLFTRVLGEFGIASQGYQAWCQKQREAQQSLTVTLRTLQDLQAQKDTLLSEQAQLEAESTLQKSGANVGQHTRGPMPDTHFFEQSTEKQHLSHVWTTDAFDLLRSQYFLAALELHEATIMACPGKFAANYKALSTMLTGQGAVSPDARVAIWDTLFFTVPVVSTTLASFGRLFSGMEQDSLGWLLIDEAGQATPQSVAGALWRSRKVVIIGDPLQIEPVLTIPEQLAAHIQKKYALEDAWSPKLHSAQTLADRTMDMGAWVGTGETAVWTGLPLRAHRRCTEPMFSVSNHIAYDGQMVQANIKPAEIVSCLGKSIWFNVQATASDGQIVAEEIEMLRSLLQQMKHDWPKVSGDNDASVYIISPFRRVAGACRTVVGALQLQNRVQAGTVHTFQGKEADIVFIVLGSAPGEAGAGSRGWASEKPNLLNVALTRAKLLVYVIGNRDDWKTCRGFDWLACTLGERTESSNEI